MSQIAGNLWRLHTVDVTVKIIIMIISPPAPKCGFLKGNEKIMVLLERVKPEIVALRETITVVSESLSL